MKKDKLGNIVEKKSKKTERVHHSISFKKAVAKLIALKWKYLMHRYQVCNDSYHWPQILNTIGDLGPIYHIDYSENITQSFKYEPSQESHFNERQYSPHCTVKDEEEKNKCFYHFSDELTHNFAFTYKVVKHLIHLDPELEIIRIKSDNCSTQYKSKNVFGKYKQLASEKVSLLSVTMDFPVIAKDWWCHEWLQSKGPIEKSSCYPGSTL